VDQCPHLFSLAAGSSPKAGAARGPVWVEQARGVRESILRFVTLRHTIRVRGIVPHPPGVCGFREGGCRNFEHMGRLRKG